jgi:hypothetical protein
MLKALQSLVAVAAILLTAAAPCLTPIDGSPACPMEHCDRAPAGALQAPSCCCAPAGAPASPSRAPAVIEALTLVAHPALAAPMLAATSAPSHATTLAPPPDPIPLYLLHATLLI